MEKIQKLGSAKRFGARYGTRSKYQFAKIEREQRKKHKCPYCNKIAVKRVFVGVWHCRKCNSKFTGKAYSITKSIVFEKAPAETQEKSEEKLPEAEEQEEDIKVTEEQKEIKEEVA